MSEMSTAFAMFKKALHKFSLSAESLAVARAAFKSGWEAREILLNKRIAEIEKAATLKERERCAKLVSDSYGWFKGGGDYHNRLADIMRMGQ